VTTIIAEPLTSTGNQIVAMLAELAADRQTEPGSHHLANALRSALRLTRPDLPLTQVHDEADRLIEQAHRDQMAAEYGETTAAVAR
jgi:hypothetical protein